MASEDVYAQGAVPDGSDGIAPDDDAPQSQTPAQANLPELITSAPPADVPSVVVQGVTGEEQQQQQRSNVERKAELKTELSSPINGPPDEATLLAINDAQNQFGTRVRKTSGAPDSTSSSPVPEAVKPASRKRPKSATSGRGGGRGGRKPGRKRRRLESPATSQRSATPAKSAKLATAARATPLDTESEDEDEEMESDPDDTNLYCICRKPDNHTWMIGCDGGCEDWFHGKCVGMVQADEALLDKFICPNCEKVKSIVTTWKPMCRRDGCRQPARLKKGGESKYCSDDCGKRFMQAMVARSSGVSEHSAPYRTRRGAASKVEETQPPLVDLGPFGGALRAHELAALAADTPTLLDFKALGSDAVNGSFPTPPASSGSPADERKNPIDIDPQFTHDEQSRLQSIAQRKSQLREQRALLKDREKFVGMVKTHATTKLEKQQCGFDPRLSWDESTFAAWRHSSGGQAAFERGSLDETEAGAEPAICLRKRCQRHATWQKLAVQDVRFEEADVGDEMRRIDGEERDIRERAAARARIEASLLAQDNDGTTQAGSIEVL